MQTFTGHRRTAPAPRYRFGVLVLSYIILAASVSVVAAWFFQPQVFRRIVTALGETRPDTAIGFLLLATALILADSSRRLLRTLSHGAALCTALLALLSGFLHWPAVSGVSALRIGMSPVTALNFTLMGAAILLLDCNFRRYAPTPVLTWITAFLSFLALAAHAFGPVEIDQLQIFSRVSGHTSLTFLLLCAAIMFARPQRGVASILFRQDLGGMAARRLLPLAVFLPFTISLLIFKMHQAGVYGYPLMVFLFLLAPVTFFVPIVLYGAALLSRLERERKQSEEELRASTQRFSSVVASAMDAIITLDESLNVIVFNEAAEKMFGCPSWEAIGKPLDRFLPAQSRETHGARIRSFGDAGVTTRSMTAPGILSALRVNGEQFPIEATISHVEVAGQKLFTVILRDITERKRAEETLRQSEARFRSIYEQAAVGIQQVAVDGRLLMVNAALCRMLGYEEHELLGSRIADITHPDDHAAQLEILESSQRDGTGFYEMEKRYRHRDGSHIWVHVTSSMVNGPDGEPLYRISVVQNLTERKRVEEQLMRADKMEAIGRLAGGVAHDFNTLLNVMLGYAELLLDELPPGDKRRDSVLQIKNSGNAGAMLTRQLLAFSRKQPIVQQVLDLREAASEITPILGRLLRDDVELTVRCSEDPCPVKVDPGQFQQLVLNLVANAGDAMPSGGQLSIEVRAVELDEAYIKQHPTLALGRYAMLVVSDTGTGMDGETVAHIFEPFFTTKDEGKGTGLGLATVYGIVKRNGGEISVYSELGVGTVFKVFLPITSEPLQAAAPAVIHSSAANGGGGQTILLVDDSAALRELTKVILQREGYNILEAEDGVAALELSSAFSGGIDLLLTDVVMPRMRGPHLAEHVLKQRPGIAIVFLSGYTEEAVSQFGGIAGFTLVEKPYTADVLLTSVRRALDDRASREELKTS